MPFSPESILLVLVLIAGLYMAWNIGANDVANAMGTSVGSGALTLKHAILIAAVLEFSGAFFFGGHVSETIQTGLIDSAFFTQNPMELVYGMLSALIATGVWLQIASYYGWPVSTTHSIVGSVVGFGAVVGGVKSVYWEQVAFVVSSWLLSPLLGGIISHGLFTFLRRKIFYASNPIAAAKNITPSLVLFVFTILSLTILYKGLNNLELQLTFFQALCISILIGLAGYWISYLCVKKIRSSEGGANIHYDFAIVENMFGYLQIITACLMAFAHGANDVANAIGPVSAAVTILLSGALSETTQVPAWALALGGLGIVVGLATWGWRVIETVGKKITELTPTRGFAAEFGAALTVLLASRLGLPISTTHTLVGAVVGVGLARGIEALDLRMTRDIFISWVVTVPAGALFAVAFYYMIHSAIG